MENNSELNTITNKAFLMNVLFPSMIKLLDCATKDKVPLLIKSYVKVKKNRLESMNNHELNELIIKLYSLPFVQEMIKSCTPGFRHNLIIDAVKLGMGFHGMKITTSLSESEMLEMLIKSQETNSPELNNVKELLHMIDFNKMSVTEFQSGPGKSKL